MCGGETSEVYIYGLNILMKVVVFDVDVLPPHFLVCVLRYIYETAVSQKEGFQMKMVLCVVKPLLFLYRAHNAAALQLRIHNQI